MARAYAASISKMDVADETALNNYWTASIGDGDIVRVVNTDQFWMYSRHSASPTGPDVLFAFGGGRWIKLL